jgi:hypothetical protein
MTHRIIRTPDDLAMLKTFLDGRKQPFTVDITEGLDRSAEQNRLAFKWYGEISEQTGEDIEDVRARCKLEIGVPIMRRDSEKFCGTYDRLVRPLPHADKLDLIRDTEMPVTSLMKVKQMTEYLDLMFRRHSEFGIVLTIPPDRFAYDPDKSRPSREQRKAA